MRYALGACCAVRQNLDASHKVQPRPGYNEHPSNKFVSWHFKCTVSKSDPHSPVGPQWWYAVRSGFNSWVWNIAPRRSLFCLSTWLPDSRTSIHTSQAHLLWENTPIRQNSTFVDGQKVTHRYHVLDCGKIWRVLTVRSLDTASMLV